MPCIYFLGEFTWYEMSSLTAVAWPPPPWPPAWPEFTPLLAPLMAAPAAGTEEDFDAFPVTRGLLLVLLWLSSDMGTSASAWLLLALLISQSINQSIDRPKDGTSEHDPPKFREMSSREKKKILPQKWIKKNVNE